MTPLEAAYIDAHRRAGLWRDRAPACHFPRSYATREGPCEKRTKARRQHAKIIGILGNMHMTFGQIANACDIARADLRYVLKRAYDAGAIDKRKAEKGRYMIYFVGNVE